LVATKDSNLSKIFKVTLRIIIYVLVQFQRKLKTVNLFYRTPNKKRTVFQKNPRVGKNTNNDTFCICIDAARNGQPLRTKPQQHQPPPPSSSSLGRRLQDDGYEEASSAAYALPLLCELSTIIQVSAVQYFVAPRQTVHTS